MSSSSPKGDGGEGSVTTHGTVGSVEALRERFGKYHVLEKIAQGGMAEVYKVKTIGIAGVEKGQGVETTVPPACARTRHPLCARRVRPCPPRITGEGPGGGEVAGAALDLPQPRQYRWS